MKSFQPYLNFDGNTREAMEFYTKACGGELTIQTFGEAQQEMPGAEEPRHARAARQGRGGAHGVGTRCPAIPFTMGTNVQVNIDCESDDELNGIFAALSEGASVTMPPQDTFWGARFGMLIEQVRGALDVQLPALSTVTAMVNEWRVAVGDTTTSAMFEPAYARIARRLRHGAWGG